MSSTPRFYVTGPLGDGGGEIALPPGAARQVTTVLRLRPGDAIRLFDGTGREWPATLAQAGRGEAVARLGEPGVPAREPARRVTLCVALLKGEKMEWVLQKGTELGVDAFQPLVTQRVEGGAGESRTVSESRQTRWERIIVEAAEQSGRLTVPALKPPVRLAEALRTPEPKAFCWEDERESMLPAALDWRAATRARLFVGPEGGFTPEEVALARAAGARVASLGPLILRAETAAIVAATLALLAP